MHFRVVLFYARLAVFVFAALGVPPAVFGQGIVSINFDDGYRDALTHAVWRLEKADMRATFYPHISEIGEVGHMTWQDLRVLAAKGHEVSSHTVTHRDLTALVFADMQAEIFGSRNMFINEKLRAYSFAYPFGSYNSAVVDELKRNGFLFARGADDSDLNNAISNRWALYSFSIISSTTIEELDCLLTRAIGENKWLILVVHEIKPVLDPARIYTITPTFLQQIVNLLYVKRASLSVLTNTQAACAIYKVGCGVVIR